MPPPPPPCRFHALAALRAATEICRQEPSPSGLAQGFPCSSGIPSFCPSPSPLVSASSSSAAPVPRWDHHPPHPTASASVNAAKESNQKFEPSRDFSLGTGGRSSPSQKCCLPCPLHPSPVWPRVGTLFPFSCFLIFLTGTLYLLTQPLLN